MYPIIRWLVFRSQGYISFKFQEVRVDLHHFVRNWKDRSQNWLEIEISRKGPNLDSLASALKCYCPKTDFIDSLTAFHLLSKAIALICFHLKKRLVNTTKSDLELWTNQIFTEEYFKDIYKLLLARTVRILSPDAQKPDYKLIYWTIFPAFRQLLKFYHSQAGIFR